MTIGTALLITVGLAAAACFVVLAGLLLLALVHRLGIGGLIASRPVRVRGLALLATAPISAFTTGVDWRRDIVIVRHQ
jgi:hypothetical protein